MLMRVSVGIHKEDIEVGCNDWPLSMPRHNLHAAVHIPSAHGASLVPDQEGTQMFEQLVTLACLGVRWLDRPQADL